MTTPTHAMLGVACLFGAVAVQPETLSITKVTMAAASLGSLAPDLDHPSSWLGKHLFFVSIPLAGMLGHRGLTHSLLAGVIATLVLGWSLQADSIVPWMVAFLLGYISHLVGDWMTGGVPLLWPSRKRFRAPFAFQTGSLFERVFALGLGTSLIFIGLRLFLDVDFGRHL